VLYHQGTEIRGKWDQYNDYIRKYADAVCVSTTDLLDGAPEGTAHLPRPIDTEFFFDQQKHEEGTALSFIRGDIDPVELIRDLAERKGLKLDVWDRNEKPIPHKSMPELLNKYEYYIDVKRAIHYPDVILTDSVLTKTALESLAVGTKVIRSNGEVITSLPERNLGANCAKLLMDVIENNIHGK
jgi:hypothetical protein